MKCKSFINQLKVLCFLLPVFSLVLIVGCDNKSTEAKRHPLVIKANNMYGLGKYDDAIVLYKKYLILYPTSTDANYKLAVIFQETGEYIPAIYYYEKFLSLSPDSSDKEIIEKWIAGSKEKLYKELGKQYSDSDIVESGGTQKHVESIDTDSNMEVEFKKLKDKNEKLEKIILKYKGSFDENTKTMVSGSKSKVKITEFDKDFYYTVKPGDSLYKISNNIYGSPIYLKKILKANKEQLSSPSKIRVGQKLLIPALNKM
ncbi:MAG TPA: LysM peptidoglycan-binding domain-containing protein [Victivallales bacterium]|nr:LysM peptidoglycan-binding domain-containing protein [Victivallales bacterium]